MIFDALRFAPDRKCLCAALSSLLVVASGAAAYAQAEKQTVIHAQIDEKHDRLPPYPLQDVEWVHEFTITLTGKNKVTETWKNTYIGNSMGPATAKQAFVNSTSRRDGALGHSDGTVVWQVLGPRKLRRIATGVQFIFMFDIDIDESNNCRIDAKYLKQVGFDDVVMKRADTGEMVRFAIPHVVSASCSIQSS